MAGLPTDRAEVISVMGTSARWLLYSAPHQAASLLFIDDPRNPRNPTRWFARSEEQPAASFAFAYDEPFQLAAASGVVLRYDIVIADRDWSRAECEEFAVGCAKTP